MTDADIKYMKEALAVDIAVLLAKDFDMNITDALDALYNSETYEKLNNSNTGLYFQSAKYVYSFLKNEFLTSKFG